MKEGCKAGSLCSTEDGMQMSQDWINEKRLEAAGIDKQLRKRILKGLDKNDGTVVRLYAGTNAQGKTRFYEIKDHPSGDPKRVIVDRAGNEYQF